MKLLRVLQEREFERLGGTRTVKVDVRLVAATNRDLRAALEQGTFREDLYYRLNVVPIDIPPLRAHKEDIPDLVNLFLARYAKALRQELHRHRSRGLDKLMQFHWPGNVRELENIVERACALAAGASARSQRHSPRFRAAKPHDSVRGLAARKAKPSISGKTKSFAKPTVAPTATRAKPRACWASPATRSATVWKKSASPTSRKKRPPVAERPRLFSCPQPRGGPILNLSA